MSVLSNPLLQDQPGIMNTFVAIINAPPNGNIAPPGIYWFHILDRGVPNKEGVYVNLVPSRLSKR